MSHRARWSADNLVGRLEDEVLEEEIVIADAVRSPMGCRGARGAFTRLPPSELLANVFSGLLDRTLLDHNAVTKIVIAGGVGSTDTVRDACSLSGLRPTVDLRVAAHDESSAQRAIHTAIREVGRNDVVLVAGVASAQLESGRADFDRGLTAERTAITRKLTNSRLLEYTRQSRSRAREVAGMGEFRPETVPVPLAATRHQTEIHDDETVMRDPSTGCGVSSPFSGDNLISDRYPAPHWSLTAAITGQVADGAAAALLVGYDRARTLGLRPRARVVSFASYGDDSDPELCGPIRATHSVLKRAGLDVGQLDHYEVGESYPSIPLAWQQEFAADHDRLNPRGGTIALGRPDAASGLRALATTVYALEATGGRLGLQTLEGKGSAGDALIIERIPARGELVAP